MPSAAASASRTANTDDRAPTNGNLAPSAVDREAFGDGCTAAQAARHAAAQVSRAGTTLSPNGGAEGLFDVTAYALEAGFLVPVAVSFGLWHDLCALPDGEAPNVLGRLNDVFFMARHALDQEPLRPLREMTFTVPLPRATDEPWGRNKDLYGVRLMVEHLVEYDGPDNTLLVLLRHSERLIRHGEP